MHQTATDNLLPLERRLRSTWAKRSAIGGFVGAAACVTTLAGLIVVGLAIDWLFNLPAWARVLMLLVWTAALAVVAHRYWWRRRRPYRAVSVALEVEKLDPSIAGLLVSGLQLKPTGARTSAELIARVQREAVERSSRLDFTQIVQIRPLKTGGLTVAAAVAAVVLLAVWQPVVMGVFAQRMLTPWSSAAYPTDTILANATGDLTVRIGEPVELSVNASGEVPDSGTLHLRMADAGWESLTLPRMDDGRFSYKLPRTSSSFDYYFAVGDAESPRFKVSTVSPPRVVTSRIRLDYPSYTGLKPQTVETFNLKIPEGTRVTWDLALDQAVAAAEMVREDGSVLPLNLTGGKQATLEQTPAVSAPYTLRFKWSLGSKAYVDDSPRHYIQIIPDAEPTAVLTLPAEDTKATLDKALQVKFAAKDDYALGNATLLYQLNDGAEQRRPLADLGGVPTAEHEQTWAVRETLKDLRPGDILTVTVEVTDRRGENSRTGRTVSRRIQFVTDAEYLAYAAARQRRYLQQLRPLYGHELESNAAIRQVTQPTTRRGNP